MRHNLACIVFVMVLSQLGLGETLSCPATIQVAETAEAQTPFTVMPGKSTHTLVTASVLNVDGKNEFDLKPDDEHTRGAKTILTWKLDDYRDGPLFLRCSYRDTKVRFSVELGKSLHQCEASLTLTAKGQITGTSSVVCR